MTRIARLLKPLDEFLRIETASGLVLLVAAAVALSWANSGWHGTYERIWDVPIPGLGPTLHYVISDGLMAVFFLVVGLEIRREIHDGALATLSQASLPLVAAAGGIFAPALIYVLLAESVSGDGWAIPTATDIAFAVGVLSLLGKRVDPGLRALLLAIAIADDVAAVLIIAFFYAEGIAPGGLAIAAGGAAAAWFCHRIGMNVWIATFVPGVAVWWGLHTAGIHPALAGVVVGLLAPMKAPGDDEDPPAERLESALHPWVAFGVMPLFALANAGTRIDASDLDDATSLKLAGGVALGLLVGKPLGIVLAALLAVRSRLFQLPKGVTVGGLTVIGSLAGIGFTMSIFIARLAFSDPVLLEIAKFGVLAGSAAAATAGLLLGLLLLPRARE